VPRTARLVVFIGFAALLALGVVLVLFDAPLEYGLDCNRFSGRCTFTQNLILRTRVGWAPIASLERAEVRVSPGRRRGSPYRVWVKSTSPGRDYFLADYLLREEAEAAARTINTFLRDPSDGRLVLTHSVRSTYWVAWSLIPAVAALIVALAAVLSKKKKDAATAPGPPGG